MSSCFQHHQRSADLVSVPHRFLEHSELGGNPVFSLAQGMNVCERHTVDGSEIRRSPVEVGSLSHHLQGFSTIAGG